MRANTILIGQGRHITTISREKWESELIPKSDRLLGLLFDESVWKTMTFVAACHAPIVAGSADCGPTAQCRAGS